MKFKVYRDADAKRLRKVVVELQDAEGKCLDKTYMFGYAAMLGFKMRVRMRQRAMLRLHKAMAELSY